jgi:pimeloyl-ACP methyl ester carboxylesterase
MIVYFISGLGADERAFGRLQLPSGFSAVHLRWLPVSGGETLAEYSARMALLIDDSKPFVLAGLSFGGMVALEICKLKKPALLILLSSVETRKELPLSYRIAGKMKLYKFIPKVSLSFILPVLYWFFGPTDRGSRILIVDFIRRIDPGYLRWALKQISCWQNDKAYHSTLRIHGSKDRAFPIRLCRVRHIVTTGGHFCVYTHADVVNAILKKSLTSGGTTLPVV